MCIFYVFCPLLLTKIKSITNTRESKCCLLSAFGQTNTRDKQKWTKSSIGKKGTTLMRMKKFMLATFEGDTSFNEYATMIFDFYLGGFVDVVVVYHFRTVFGVNRTETASFYRKRLVHLKPIQLIRDRFCTCSHIL